jgi:DNA-binding CsgD family transcriptional regulator
MGVVMLDADARVRATNARARRIFDDGDGLRLAGGRIEASRRHDAALLESFLHGACPHEVVGGGLHARGTLQIEHAADRGTLTVLVADAHGLPGAPASEFVLFLHERDTPISISEATLCALHGLTQTEARIAARLVDGGLVSAIAVDIGVSRNTVRTHLKRVFGKLGVRSQAALIRVVLSGPAALQLNGARIPSLMKPESEIPRALSRVAP